jgi:hypothetical protein
VVQTNQSSSNIRQAIKKNPIISFYVRCRQQPYQEADQVSINTNQASKQASKTK